MSEPRGLGAQLNHYDPAQLWYQCAEIIGADSYVRHGVEVRPGDVVLDVGANVGVASAYFAEVCEAGAVHSFEPVEPVYDLLRENVARFDACHPHPYGLGAEPGLHEITYYPAAAAMSSLDADAERDAEHQRICLINAGVDPEEAERRSVAGFADPVTLTCELRTLSAEVAGLGIERVDLLKVDVEGTELDVLAGIGDDDWPRIGQVAIEAHRDETADELTAELGRRGFTVASEQDPIRAGTGVRMLYAVRRP